MLIIFIWVPNTVIYVAAVASIGHELVHELLEKANLLAPRRFSTLAQQQGMDQDAANVGSLSLHPVLHKTKVYGGPPRKLCPKCQIKCQIKCENKMPDKMP